MSENEASDKKEGAKERNGQEECEKDDEQNELDFVQQSEILGKAENVFCIKNMSVVGENTLDQIRNKEVK